MTPDARANNVRNRILNATVACLTDRGYAATTTRAVANLAGVSQGAQQHYFRTKARLVDAALQRIIAQWMERGSQRVLAGATENDRALELLDLLWDMHHHPLTPAVLELINAARTDQAVAQRVTELAATIDESIQTIARTALPTYAQSAGFSAALHIALSTCRGTVLLGNVPGMGGEESHWPTIRTHLHAMLIQLEPAT